MKRTKSKNGVVQKKRFGQEVCEVSPEPEESLAVVRKICEGGRF